MAVGDGDVRWWSDRHEGSWRRLMKAVASGWAPVGGGVPLSSLAVADTPPRGCLAGGDVDLEEEVADDGGAGVEICEGWKLMVDEAAVELVVVSGSRRQIWIWKVERTTAAGSSQVPLPLLGGSSVPAARRPLANRPDGR
ncbi:hypothetical protein Dimus_039778 [Dionaea muscipula]